jgi:hypothetical protein
MDKNLVALNIGTGLILHQKKYIMRGKRFYNDKGQEHGPWSMVLEDGYFEGHYLNGIRYGFWELSRNITLTKVYYAR